MTEDTHSRWSDGAVYAATVDRLLTGLRSYLATHLPPGERVLDACCGTGALARRLAREGRTVVGVDLSPRHIAFARDRAAADGVTEEAVRFEVGDVAALDTPAEGPWDVAVITLALHEMPTAARTDVLENLLRIARRVVAVDFVAPMPWSVAGARNRLAEVAAGIDHVRAFRDYQRRGGLTPLVEAVGAVVEATRTIDAGTLDVMTLTAGVGT